MGQTFTGSKSYVASEDLIRSVNIAMALEKPLLIKGEPGTGKTMLAQAISEALHMKLIIWNIKSTTKAQDGLYVYDTVQRLYDSQFEMCIRDSRLPHQLHPGPFWNWRSRSRSWQYRRCLTLRC